MKDLSDVPKTCAKCGREDATDARYCSVCGERLSTPQNVRFFGWALLIGAALFQPVVVFACLAASRGEAGKSVAKVVCLCVMFLAVDGLFVVVGIAGLHQVLTGRMNRLCLWVERCFIRPDVF
jgi:hypothetical protein